MTTAVASAPAPAAPAAAPAAPAAATPAPAAPSAPAWASGQNVSDWMKGVTSNAPAAPAAPATPAPAAPAASAAPTTTVVAPPQPAAPEAAQPPVEGQPPVPASAQPEAQPRLYAGRYKTPEELENVYAESSREGRRLSGLVKERDAALKQTAAETQRITSELESLKLLHELGPEPSEPKQEEMDTWSAAKVAKYFDDKAKRSSLKQQLEAKKAAAVQAVKEASEKRQGEVLGLFNQMAGDEKRFPQFRELAPVMDEFMDLEPGVIGHPKTPLILYLAARGHVAIQLEQEAARRSGASTEAARATAAAGLPGVSAPGGAAAAPAPGTVPASGALDPDSDQAHGARILAAARKMSSTAFPGIS